MEYVGGYEDWVRVKKHQHAPVRESAQPKPAIPTIPAKPKNKSKLSFKDAQELEQIPVSIQALEREQAEIGAILAAGKMYRDDPKQAKNLQVRAAEIDKTLLEIMSRWEELESKANKII